MSDITEVPDRRKPMEKRRDAAAEKKMDRESKVVLFQGASVSQLGTLFARDNRTIAAKIQALEPAGYRGGFPVYAIRDAAPYLVKPSGDMEEYLKKMKPEDLPPELNKAFWAGQRERNRFLEENGELWHTEKVLEVLGQAFSSLRLNMELMQDTVEEQTSFSDQQRTLLQELVDAALGKCREDLISQFGGPDGDEGLSEDESGDGFEAEVYSDEEEDDDFFRVNNESDPEAL